MFVFHSKLNVRANRIKMRVESRNVLLVENRKGVIHIPQSKTGRSMKRSDSCVFNVFHIKILEPMGVPKVCLKKDFLHEKTVESKHIWRPCLTSEILRRVREGKELSDARSSNTRSRALSTGTDANKLTTSNDTKYSFSSTE